MAHQQVTFRAAELETILCVTPGPKSKSGLIQRNWGRPLVCNDGVTIAKEFDLKDPEENLGAQMIRQAAERTGESVDDGFLRRVGKTHSCRPTARRAMDTLHAGSGGTFGAGRQQPGRMSRLNRNFSYENRPSDF